MVRTLLTWRWLALTVVLLVAVAGMVTLAQWQWQRSVPEPQARAVDLATVEASGLPGVVEVAGPDGAAIPSRASGDLVSVEGRWRPDRTLLVSERDLDGRPGRWVVTAVELDGSSGAPGRLVPVVRGWLPAQPGSPAQQVPPVANRAADREGDAAVVGWLQQSEPLDLPIDVVQPDGVAALLSTADLVNRWPEDLVPGFVVAAPTPQQQAGSALALLPEPPAEQQESRDWRNLAYWAQWYVFAGFAVLLWWRMLRDDAARERSTT